MVPSSPNPSTEIASNSTMNAQNQDTFLWCKSQFESALMMFRLGCGELDFPQFGNERFEADISNNILFIQSRVANEELVQYYLLALDRKTNDQEDNPNKPSQDRKSVV